VLEWQQYHLVAFTGVSSGSTSNRDGSLSESIVEALNKIGDSEYCNNKGYDSDEYDVAMKKFKAELAQEELEKKQAAAKQVSWPAREMMETRRQRIHQHRQLKTRNAHERGIFCLPPPTRPMMTCRLSMADQVRHSP
jgi:hypothetical protein